LRPRGPAPAHDFVARDVSIYSRADGLLWCGTTHEHHGFDREPSESAYHEIYTAACRLMPALAEAELVKQTACLRPLAADGLPIVGRAPGLDNVYLATGA